MQLPLSGKLDVVASSGRTSSYYVGRLHTSAAEPGRLMADLKLEPSDLVLKVFASIQDKPHLVARAFPGAFPTRYADLRSLPASYESDDLDRELRWLALRSKLFSQRLTDYLSCALAFESALLLGAVDQASHQLNSIHNRHGYSAWSLEASLLLAECRGGIQELRSTLTDINARLAHTNERLLANTLADKVENTVSPALYDSTVRKLLDVPSATGQLAQIIEHFRFRLAFHLWHDTPHRGGAVYLEGRFSIIDGYNVLIRTCQALVSAGRWKPSPDTVSAFRALRSSLVDHRLVALHQYLEPDYPVTSDALSCALHEVIETYTTGHYASAIQHAQTAIARFPQCFDLYELRAKAHIHANIAPSPAPLTPTLSDTIADLVYHAIHKGAGATHTFRALTKHAYALDCTRFGQQLLAFALQYRPSETPLDPLLLQIISQMDLTPRFSIVYRSQGEVRAFLTALDSAHGVQSASTLFRELSVQSTPDIPVPPERLLKQRARSDERNGDYPAALRHYRSLAGAAKGRIALIEDALTGQFRCLLHLTRLADAARVAANAYFTNPLLLASMNLLKLLSSYQQEPAQHASDDPVWPLLYYLAFSDAGTITDTYRLYTALDELLTARSVTMPSQLIGTGLEADPHFQFVLRNVCVPEVLDSSYHFESVDDLEQERIRICHFLMKADSPNEGRYFAEITDLSRQSVIRRAIKHVDDSKVYVDLHGIRTPLQRALTETFERYLQVARIPNAALRQVAVAVISAEGSKSPVVLADLASLLLQQMFLEVRSQFLLNTEHGLDSYLSIRIRHGTLAGQLRRLFESLHLVTRRGTLERLHARAPRSTR
jgi:hypothetical protein